MFTQDNLVNINETVINEGPAMEVLIVFKASIWTTGIVWTTFDQLDNLQWYFSFSRQAPDQGGTITIFIVFGMTRQGNSGLLFWRQTL